VKKLLIESVFHMNKTFVIETFFLNLAKRYKPFCGNFLLFHKQKAIFYDFACVMRYSYSYCEKQSMFMHI